MMSKRVAEQRTEGSTGSRERVENHSRIYTKRLAFKRSSITSKEFLHTLRGWM